MQNSVNEYVETQVNSAVSTVKSSINSTVSSIVMTYYGQYGTAISEKKDELRQTINLKLNAISFDDNGIIGQAANNAWNASKNNISQVVDSVIGELDNLATDNIITEINKKINNKVDTWVNNNIKNRVQQFVESKSTALKSKVNNAVTDTTGKISDSAKEEINDALKQFEGKTDDIKLNLNTDSKDSTKTINMNYKQYVKVFTLIGLLTNQDNLLHRCAALIQVNMNKQQDGKKSYHMNKAYTMVKIDAEVNLDTIFDYSVGVTEDTDGLYSGLSGLWSSTGESTMEYHSLMGF